MEDLRELINIVSPKKIEALERSGGMFKAPDPLVRRLYDLIAEGKVQTNEAAMHALFGSAKSGVRYRRIRDALREYLYDLLLLTDSLEPHSSERQKAYYDCYKKWAALKLLSGKNARLSLLELAKSTLRIAQKYEFTEVSLDIYRLLRQYHGSRQADLARFEHYGRLASEYEAMLACENLAEDYYAHLMILLAADSRPNQEQTLLARQYFQQLEPYLLRYDSFRLHFFGRLIEVFLHTVSQDHQQAVQACNRAIKFFNAKNYNAHLPLQVFLYQEMVSYLQLRDYKNGEEASRMGLRLLESGSFNWFKYQELLLYLSLHSEHYRKALEVWQQVARNRRFAGLPFGIRQSWNILEGLLTYLAGRGELQDTDNALARKRFRLEPFLQNMPAYSPENRALDVPTLWLQILFLLQQRRFSETTERIEALSRYILKRPSGYHNLRSNYLIQMLQQLPAAGFQPEEAERLARPMLKQLLKTPQDFSSNGQDFEPIPYEVVWNMLLSSLQENRNELYR